MDLTLADDHVVRGSQHGQLAAGGELQGFEHGVAAGEADRTPNAGSPGSPTGDVDRPAGLARGADGQVVAAAKGIGPPNSDHAAGLQVLRNGQPRALRLTQRIGLIGRTRGLLVDQDDARSAGLTSR